MCLSALHYIPFNRKAEPRSSYGNCCAFDPFLSPPSLHCSKLYGEPPHCRTRPGAAWGARQKSHLFSKHTRPESCWAFSGSAKKPVLLGSTVGIDGEVTQCRFGFHEEKSVHVILNVWSLALRMLSSFYVWIYLLLLGLIKSHNSIKRHLWVIQI